MSRSRTSAAALAVACLLGACASYPRNDRLATFDADAGYRFSTRAADDDADRLFVVLAFSGGGTRAAALSYGVMQELAATRLPDGRSLLDEVDVISSVSGGSFTAAYYGLFGPRLFADYEREVLDRDIQGDLARRTANPLNWPRLASARFDRIDLAAEFYDEELFEGATFADMAPGRPFVVLNATDMSLGARFEFTQEQFDLIGSDLASFPVARAVAASSAFPFLLTPVRLVNHPDPPGFSPPLWIELSEEDRHASPGRYRAGRAAATYLEADADGGKARRFLHLLDGGISDNLGLRGVITAMTTNDGGWSLLDLANEEKLGRVVVIAVDAMTAASHDWDAHESAPGLVDVAMTVATTPMDNYSMETLRVVHEHAGAEAQAVQGCVDCEALLRDELGDEAFDLDCPASVPFHYVEVRFDDIPDPAPADWFGELRPTFDDDLAGWPDWFGALPTSFVLDEREVDRLRDVGRLLLRHAPPFEELLAEIGAGG